MNYNEGKNLYATILIKLVSFLKKKEKVTASLSVDQRNDCRKFFMNLFRSE